MTCLYTFSFLFTLNTQRLHTTSFEQVADITHSLQQPASRSVDGGGVASGGLRDMIPCIARTCVAVGIDGIFMEVHDDPLTSPVDAPTQWPLRNFKALLEELSEIAKASKVRVRSSEILSFHRLNLQALAGKSTHANRLDPIW